MEIQNICKKVLLGTAGSIAVSSGAAFAQVDEIFVEATRRSESIQDVPISATAYGEEDIDGLRLQTSRDIGNQAPNITLVQGNFGFGAPIVSIRGVTNGDFSATSNTPVTVYADDIVLTQIVSHGFSLYDLERVELLRGPQGTLFGRNSTSGALQFISAKPTDEFSVGGSFSYARHNDFVGEGYISGPIAGDALKGRVAFYYRDRDGVVENTFLNQDESEVENWSVRGIFTSAPSDSLDLSLKVQHSRANGTGVIFHNSLGDNPYLTGFGPVEPGGDAGEFEQIQLDLPSRPEEVEQTEIVAKAVIDLGNSWNLTGIFGYVDLDFEEFNDDDATILRAVHEYANRQIEQVSGELRLAGQLGPIDLVSGLFYLDENTKSIGAFEFTDDPLLGTAAQIFTDEGVFGPGFARLMPTDRLVGHNELEQDLTAYAIFAHGKVALTDQFGVSGGVRYSRDEKDIRVFDGSVSSFSSSDPFAYGQSIEGNAMFTNFQDLSGVFGPAGAVTGESNSDAFTGEVSLEFTPSDDSLLYASYRRGFKGSSFDATQTSVAFGIVPDVPQESINAYEIGAKTSWFNDRLLLNGAAFFYDYNDFQAFEFLTVGGFLTNLLISIPEVEIKGVELELQANPVEGLNFTFGAGFIDSEITDNNVLLPPGVTLTIAEGNEVRNAPEVNLNASASYDMPVAGGKWFVTPQVDWFYVGEYFSDFLNTAPGTTFFFLDPLTFAPTPITATNGSVAGGYHHLNLRLSLTDAEERYRLTVFGENITDEVQVTGRFPGNFPNSGTDFATVNDGNRRIWGVRLDFDF